MTSRDKTKLIARERIKILFEQAASSFKENPKRSSRYVQLAIKISLKTKTKIPKEYKKRFCKHCFNFLQPGVNCRIRTRNKKLIYFCFNCRHYMRFGLLKKK